MKNTVCKIKRNAVSLSVLTILLFSTIVVTADTSKPQTIIADWEMKIENTEAESGDIGHIIPITGVWADSIVQYRCNITFDPDMLELTELDLEGCIGEGYSIYIKTGDDYCFLMVQGLSEPAGNGLLANLIVNVTGEDGTSTYVCFQGGQDYNLYKASGGYQYPVLYNGLVQIGELIPKLEIKSITGGSYIQAIVKNAGFLDATNIQWTISVEGGLFVLPRETTGIIETLQIDGEQSLNANVFGIGLGIITDTPVITVSASCDEGSTVEEVIEGKILFTNVII